MRWPKLRELKEAITSALSRPYTHPFPAVPTPAPPNLRGRPVHDPERCIGCGACAEVCPAGAITVEDVRAGDGNGRFVRRITLDLGRCIFCGDCVRCCSTGDGIALSGEYDLAAFDRADLLSTIERELALCELCGRPIAPRAQLLWLHRRLGAKSAATTTVFLAAMEELGLREAAPRDDRPLDRSDIQRMLCPACRRSVTLLDEWGPV